MAKNRLWRVTYQFNSGACEENRQEEFRNKFSAEVFISRLSDFDGVSNIQLAKTKAIME
ncbi:MAG: hypothetical protein IJ437_01345 [Clostridia bacterium]|nr:hypothetical protein [Clostridia bacterium]